MNVEHDSDGNRFVARFEDDVAVLGYTKPDARTLDLQHTFVPEAERGDGVGGRLVKSALDYAREQNLHVIPTCPFVQEWLTEHPEYRDLVATR